MNDRKFYRISHRGYGIKTNLRYALGENVFVHNQLTGLEVGVERGANTLELDLNKTKDGHIVTGHGIPFARSLSLTKDDYLHQYPEALTLLELIEWLHHNPDIVLYLELKTKISIAEIADSVSAYVETTGMDAQESADELYDRIMLYSNSTQQVGSLIKEKQERAMKTSQFKLFIVLNRPVSKKFIDKMSKLGSDDCRLYGVEQGALILANDLIFNLLKTPFAYFPPVSQIRRYYKELSSIIEHAHRENLHFIFGTVDDDAWMRFLLDCGVDGVVPNDPAVFENTIKNKSYKKNYTWYVPSSLRLRVSKIKSYSIISSSIV